MMNAKKPPQSGLTSGFMEEVYSQEAEALRKDLVRYFADGDVLDELGVRLRELIQDALKQVVREALQDEDTRKTIQQQVQGIILNNLKTELATAQQQIVNDLKQGLIATWRQEIKSPLRQEVTSAPPLPFPVTDPVDPKRPGKGFQQPTVEAKNEPIQAPQQQPFEATPHHEARRFTFSLDRTLKVSLIIIIPIATVLLTWLLFSPAKPEHQGRDSQPKQEETPVETTEAEFGNLDDQPQEVGVNRGLLRDTWMSRMEVAEGDLPLDSLMRTSLKAHSTADQFGCWFDEASIKQLEELVTNPRIDNQRLQSDLKRGGVFDNCVQEVYDLSRSQLPIFGTQAMIHVAMQSRETAGWTDCPDSKRPREVPDLAAFRADGQRGPKTYGLLNGYLACSGLSSRIKIGPNSTTPEYLVALYAALKELSQEP